MKRFLGGFVVLISVLLLSLVIPGTTASAQTPLTPSTLSFGNQVVNQSSAAMRATLKNTQAVPLSISSIAIGGGNAPADYVAGGDCPISPSTLGPGENCTITVTFTPSALGMRTATLTVVDTARTSPLTVALRGTAVAPADVAPGSSNSGAVAVGYTNATPSGTLTPGQSGATASSGMAPSEDFARNRPGTITLPSRASGGPSVIPLGGLGNSTGLISITVTPANPSIVAGNTQQFAATGYFRNGTTQNLTSSVLWTSSATGVATINAAGLASSVTAGSTTITATFVTASPLGQARGATPGTPIVVTPPTSPITGSATLTVTAAGPVVTLTNSSLNFGPQAVGTTSSSHTVTLYNTGTAVLTISNIAVTGTNASDFAQINTCGASVAAGNNCTISVTFTPTALGPRTASVSIADNAAGSPHNASLMGTTPLINNTLGLPFGVVNTSYNATLTASGGNPPYTWSISSGALPSWAMLTASTGVISGTPNATGTSNFTVKVTDSSTPTPLTALRGFNITTNSTAQPLSITTTFLPDGTVGIPYSNALTAFGGTGVYTWSIVSGAGSLPPCLNLGNFYINGTPVNTCEGSFGFTVKVTDSASNTATQALSIKIDPASSTVCESGNESVLQGQYVFNLIGYNSGGFFVKVGAFTADGAGNITGGEFDRVGIAVAWANPTLTGTYSVGADNRGCATFHVSGGGSFNTRFVLGSISGPPATAAQGRIIEYDSPNTVFIASGQIFQQTTSTTANSSNFSALNGGYVHLWTGWDTNGNGGRIACDGVKTDTPTSGSAGTIASGEQYCNDEGVAPTGPTTGITGSYTGVDNYGRFTETFGTTNIVGYMVSTAGTGALEWTNNSAGIFMAGQEFQQSGGPFGQSSLSGTSVYYANGVNSSTSGKILLALTSADGVHTLSLNPYYENDGGTWTANGTTGSCTYTVATNGGVSGCGGEFYLSAPNTAVYVGNDAGGFGGYVVPQTVPNGGFTAVSGTFFGATSEIINQDAEADDDLDALSTTGGIISGTDIGDSSAIFYQQADSVQQFTGPTLNSNGTITQSSQIQAIAIDQQHFLSPNRTGCSSSPSCYPTIEVLGPSTADTVAVTINGASSSSAGVQAGTTLVLTLAVTGTTSTSVTWTINGLPSGSGYGTITGAYPSYTYNAPTRLPQPATFTITATSNADVSQSASVSVTISAPAGVSPFSITTTSLPNGTVGTEYAQDIQTTGGTLGIGWSVTSGSLPPGFVLQGTPNGVGMIHGFTTATGTYTFTVTASDSSSPKQFASQQLSIVINTAPLSILTTSLLKGLTGESYNQTVVATGGTQPYTWSITFGSLPGWATLNSSTGAITGMPLTTGTSNFTVTVTDSTLPTHKTASQPLSITINSGAALACTDSGSESLLNGQYAFSLSGYTSSGYLAVVGSFTAHGDGTITAGEADTNGVLGVQNSVIDTTHSSYSVGSNNLGCATIVTTFGTFNTRLSLGSITSNVATAGRMVEWDAPNSNTYFAATGQLQQQNASSFSGGLAGSSSFVFEESGVDSNAARMAIVGVFSTGSSSNFTSGEFDVNDSGTTSNVSGVSGTYSSADGNGRITGNNTWTGQTSANDFVIYMVSSSNVLVLTTDAVSTSGALAGQMQQQTVPGGGFNNSSFNTTDVLYTAGLNGGGTGGSVNLVLLSADGNGNLTGTSYYDGGGTWKTPKGISCTYSIDPSGRMTCGTGAPVFYLTAANQGVVLSSDTDIADGQFGPQSAGPFSSSYLSGAFYVGDLEVVSYGVASGGQIGVGVVTLDGSGNFSFIGDGTSTTGGQYADGTDSGPIGTVNSNGTFSLSSSGAIDAIIISATRFLAVDNENSTYPIIQFFRQ